MKHALAKAGGWVLFLAAASLEAAAPAVAPGTSAGASAQPNLGDSLTGQAKADYEAARLLYLDGDPASAIVKFQSAYDASHEPRLLWNLAACQKQLRHYSQLEALLRRFLVEGGSAVSEADRAEATTLLETIRPFVADVTVQLNEAGAKVSVDGQHVGSSPLPNALRLDLGPRRLKVEKAGFVSHEELLDVRGGAAMALTVTLQPERHQGTLRVLADSGAQIQIDGQAKGVGVWTGVMSSGAHSVEVTAAGKLPYRTDVVITDDQTNTLRAMLENRPVASGFDTTWLWIAGGAVLAAGLGVVGYYQFGPDQRAPAPVTGTWAPGTVSVSHIHW